MLMDDEMLQRLSLEIERAHSFLLVSHVNPDGDAVGSLLGFGLALQAAGKHVQAVSVDGVPSKLRHLEGIALIQARPTDHFEYSIVLDCSDLDRIEGVLDGRLPPDLNIDHHKTNTNFARINLVNVSAVATAEIIADLIPLLGLSLPLPAAAALLTGLIADTIGFSTSNMTPKALRLAADLMERGLDMPQLYRLALFNRSFEASRLWAAGLSRLERNGRMVWTTLTQQDRKVAGYPGQDDADLVNELSAIEEADIAVIFVEKSQNKVKVSWRARPGLDVSQIAYSYGGGGHAAASGAEISGGLQQVQADVLSRTRALLKKM